MGTITRLPGGEVLLANGHRVQVRHAGPENGDAPAVVMVHGLGGSSTNWTALMRQLSDELNQWAPDLPGFGDSPPSGCHSVDGYVADVSAYMERFDGPVHLVGNSMGGLICVLVAASRPDLVKNLVLLSPAMPQYRLPWGAQAMAVVATPRLGEWLLGRVNGEPTQEQIERLAPMLYGDPEGLDRDELAFAVQERLRWTSLPHADAVVLSALRSLVSQYLTSARRSAWWVARKVLCPTMVVVSGKDALVGSWAARKWQRTLPGARVVKLLHSGHVSMMEHPQTVAHLIRTFYQDVSEI